MTLAVDAYTGGEQFQLEKRTLFAREWLLFCAAGQLPEPGAFVTHTIGGWPLFVVRGLDGALRGFRNVCRHQKMMVVDKSAGRCDELRCRFHGWTYDLAGSFVSAPSLVAPESPNASDNSLEHVELAERQGLVLLRLEPGDGEAAPAIPLGKARYLSAMTMDVSCNWKTLLEQLIVDDLWRYVWPIGCIRSANGVAIVRQIVPRTFLRTRLVDLIFTGGASDDVPLDRLRAEAEQDRARAEELQTRRAASEPLPATTELAAFHQRLANACR